MAMSKTSRQQGSEKNVLKLPCILHSPHIKTELKAFVEWGGISSLDANIAQSTYTLQSFAQHTKS